MAKLTASNQVNATPTKKLLSDDPSKKKVSFLLARSVYDDIERMSNHHPGILKVATRLTYFITPLLPCGHSTFLDLTLSQAMTEFHAHYIDDGIEVAYKAYCRAIFKAIPEIFNYSVTGAAGSRPFLITTWDCTLETLSEWLVSNDIHKCQITYNKVNTTLSPAESAFLLASRVFTRHELSFFGVSTEMENLVNAEESN